MWSKFRNEFPTDNTYIICRNSSGCYVEGKYVGNGSIEVANGSFYYNHIDDYWVYLPKEFQKKREIHIWLDFSGCMPKDCCITFKATIEAIREEKEHINTVQTKIPVDDIIEGDYKLFIHAGNKKREITGDFNINQVIEEWNI